MSGELLAWESTTPCFIRYVTDSQYRKFSPAVQRWYRPICQKCGPSHDQGCTRAARIPTLSR
jgi:hypothetical protein